MGGNTRCFKKKILVRQTQRTNKMSQKPFPKIDRLGAKSGKWFKTQNGMRVEDLFVGSNFQDFQTKRENVLSKARAKYYKKRKDGLTAYELTKRKNKEIHERIKNLKK